MIDRGFRITGRVQGVGFRWWTRSTAERLGVVGTVRNRPDGSVEVMARADAEALERLAEKLRTGPPLARVDGVETVSPELPARIDGFAIEHGEAR